MLLTAEDFIASLAKLNRLDKTEGLGKELHTFHIGDKAVLVVTSALDLDTDGFTGGGTVKLDDTHQCDTSLHWPHGSPVDSNLTRYVVIPLQWGARHGIKLGDVGLAQFHEGHQVVGVIAADYGPHDKIGEGSMALHRAFGHETLVNGKIHDVGMDGIFRLLLFPGTSKGCCISNDEAETIAFAKYQDLIRPETERRALKLPVFDQVHSS